VVMDRRTFETAGIKLSYIDTGPRETSVSANLPVLLIHGFASNLMMNWVSTGWVQDLVNSGRRVIAFDNRGHGESEKLYELADYGAPIMAADAVGLLDHLGITRAHVVGYSMGARIAAFLALSRPDLTASVTFGGLGLNMVRGMAGTGPIAHALEAASIDDVTNPTARTFRAFAEQTKSDLKALAACIRSARAPITPVMIATISSSALVVVGENDVIGGSAEGLAKLIPNARAVTLPGREHMKAVGDRLFKAETIAFLDQVEGMASELPGRRRPGEASIKLG
jgi:pimeloyl-ACP methyl ester carboxylesterase